MTNKRRSNDLGERDGKKKQFYVDKSLSPRRFRSRLLIHRARQYRSPVKSLASSSSIFESSTRRCLHNEPYCSFCKVIYSCLDL